jgi:hypothetical protein
MTDFRMNFRADITQQLEPFAAHVAGDPFASVIAVKGRAGTTELDGGPPFSGADGLALDKAFGRLGWGYGSRNTRVWFGVLLELPGHNATAEQSRLAPQALRLICEIIDPLAIVTLDDAARVALTDAFGPVTHNLAETFATGADTTMFGRQLLSVEDFEDALVNESAKQRAWAQLKRCTFPA